MEVDICIEQLVFLWCPRTFPPSLLFCNPPTHHCYHPSFPWFHFNSTQLFVVSVTLIAQCMASYLPSIYIYMHEHDIYISSYLWISDFNIVFFDDLSQDLWIESMLQSLTIPRNWPFNLQIWVQVFRHGVSTSSIYFQPIRPQQVCLLTPSHRTWWHHHQYNSLCIKHNTSHIVFHCFIFLDDEINLSLLRLVDCWCLLRKCLWPNWCVTSVAKVLHD